MRHGEGPRDECGGVRWIGPAPDRLAERRVPERYTGGMNLRAWGLALLVACVAWTCAAQPRPPAGDRAFQTLLAHEPGSGAELIGRRAPRWTFERWVRGGPLSLASLRGHVVLLRWWTDGCAYCAASLPALEQVRTRHPDDLVVIGVYHPKPPRAISDQRVLAAAARLGFGGPIAVDEHWSTLERWWLDGADRSFTSVTFLLDRDGVIRWVHQGGDLHPGRPGQACERDWRGLEQALDRALAAPARPRG